ncbi:MAG: hypothetical protein SGI88_22475 [Candidatus Hydrogenedentes bacterium]|nr:hypothetical protein [Candidatus Hydrogenedentota bacterium]
MRSSITQILPICALCLVVLGCQTAEPRQSMSPGVPAGAPNVADIIASLQTNDTALSNFRAAGTLTLESPKLKSIQRFPSGIVAYRRPADLYVVGKNALGATLFKLTSRDAEFLIEFPAVSNTDDRYYYSFEGEQFADVPFSVLPADVAREMFMPVDWDTVTQDSARLTGYDPQSGEATIEIDLSHGLTRKLTVRGEPWVIVGNVLRNSDGSPLSETRLSDFTENNGVRFPARSEAWFPIERTRLSFDLRNIRINTELDAALFNITWRPGQ